MWKRQKMVFHRGRRPDESFMYKGKPLEIVVKFTYLGFVLSVQLSFTQHLEAAISKARARIGMLFAKLPIQNIPLHLVIKLFELYIAPIFHYGLILWISKCSQSSLRALDAVWTKYLKRYLGLPRYANNGVIYHITESQPLSNTLESIAPHKLGGLVFPQSFAGMKLSFISDKAISQSSFNPIPVIPTTFWVSRVVNCIPTMQHYRHRLMREIFDIAHLDICMTTSFHCKIEEDCKCNICNLHAHSYHMRYCTGPLAIL